MILSRVDKKTSLKKKDNFCPMTFVESDAKKVVSLSYFLWTN